MTLIGLAAVPAATIEQSAAPLPAFRRFGTLGEVPAEPQWLWNGFLAPGSLTMLAGHPFAGKSMLVAGLLRALAGGRPFLGRETVRSSAVLLTEEDDQVLRSRSDRFGLIGTENTFLSRSGGIFRHTWAEMVNGAASHALEDGHRLLIVDTFSGLADLHSEEENDAGAIAERLRLLQAAAGRGLAVLFLHHFNKVGQPRGSGAFRGVVDISVRLDRPKNNSRIMLRTESRYPTATPASLTATLIEAGDGWFYESDGTPSKTVEPVGERSTDEQLWDALAEAGNNGLSYRDLDKIPGLSADKGKKRFPAWLAEGRLTRTGGGTKTDPYRFAAKVT